MKNTFMVLAVGSLVLMGTGCDKLRSRDALNHGVQAYKSAKYADAVEYFKTAVSLDPANQNGRLYLATAYMTQYIPGAESPENMQLAKQAKEEFGRVLERDPNDRTALASLASLSYHDYEGIAVNDAEKARLVNDLGSSTNFILRNHGLLTVGPAVADAFLMMFNLQRACEIQVRAQGAAVTAVDPRILAGVKANAEKVTRGLGGQIAWPALLRKLERLDASYKS